VPSHFDFFLLGGSGKDIFRGGRADFEEFPPHITETMTLTLGAMGEGRLVLCCEKL